MGRYDSAIELSCTNRWIRLDIRTYENKIRRLNLRMIVSRVRWMLLVKTRLLRVI